MLLVNTYLRMLNRKKSYYVDNFDRTYQIKYTRELLKNFGIITFSNKISVFIVLIFNFF